MTPITAEHLLVALVLFSFAITFPFSLVRLSGVYIQDFLNVMLFSTLATGVFVFLKNSFNQRFSYEAPIILYVIFFVHALILGVANHGLSEALPALRYYILGLIMLLIQLHNIDLQRMLYSDFLWKFVLFTHILGFVFYKATLEGTVYPGIGVPSIAFAGFYFLISRQKTLAALSFALVFLEGKRSILLACLLGGAFLLTLTSRSKGVKLQLVMGVVVALAVIISLLLIIAPLSEAPFGRINLLNPFSSRFEPFIGSSGRLGEIVSYIGDKTWGELLLGDGFGFKYDWSLGFASESEGEVKGYFHMSPMNFLASGGLIGLIAFCGLWLPLFGCKPGESSELFKLRACFLMVALFSLNFGFNTSGDSFFWLLIVMQLQVQRRMREGKAVSKCVE